MPLKKFLDPVRGLTASPKPIDQHEIAIGQHFVLKLNAVHKTHNFFIKVGPEGHLPVVEIGTLAEFALGVSPRLVYESYLVSRVVVRAQTLRALDAFTAFVFDH